MLRFTGFIQTSFPNCVGWFYLALGFLLLPPGTASAQVTIPRLVCRGEMPDDFRLRYSEKYEESLVKKGAESTKNGGNEEFTALTTIAIDNLFRSGKVLYGDEVTLYCNRVLDSLLAGKPQLRKELRVYTLRSNEINAFSTHQGVMLITTGLLARLESEAQLAFVLAHEAAHYTEKHSLKAYEYTTNPEEEDIRLGRKTFDEDILRSSRHSRQAEFDADAFGMELYLAAGYPPVEALRALDILLYAYLPVCNAHFDFASVEDEQFKISEKAKEYTFTSVFADEKVNDSKSTHPNNHRRKERLKEFVESRKVEPELEVPRAFKIGLEEFMEVRALARNELTYNFLINHQYVETLMLCDAWKDSSWIDKQRFSYARAMSYYGLQCLANLNIDEHLPDLKGLQGPQVSYFHLFRNLSRPEINLLAVREIWKIYQSDPGNQLLKELLDHSLMQLSLHSFLVPEYFEPQALKERETGTDDTCHTCSKAFRGDEFGELYDIWKTAKPKNDELMRDQLPKKGKRKKKKNPTPVPKLKRMLVLSPRYFGLDLRKPIETMLLNEDKKQQYIEETLVELAHKKGIDVLIPDSRTNRDSLTEDFNHYATLMDWVGESGVFAETRFRSYLKPALDSVRDYYQVDHLTVPVCWSFLEGRDFSMGRMVVVFFVPYYLPFYLYWQLTPRSYMVYGFFVLNMETGRMDYSRVSGYEARYRDYLLKAHLYHSLNQISE